VKAVTVQGRKAYTGQFRSDTFDVVLTVLNITDPADLTSLGTRNAPTHTFDLHIEGDMLFAGCDGTGGVPDGDGDLFIYNFSIPSNNYILDSFTNMEGLPTGLDAQGHFLYLATYQASADHGFYILDIEDPTNVQQIANTMIFSELLDVDVDGQFAYLADGTYGLYVVNVSDPYALVTEGSVNTPGNATAVLVDGHLAYLADGDSGIHIIDISDPTTPTILGSYNTPGNAQAIALQGNTLFVADRGSGVIVLDVTNPNHPAYVDTIIAGDVYDLDLFGGVLVVGTATDVRTYSIGSITDLPLVGSFSGYEAWDVRVQGNIAYIAAGPDGLVTLDVSDPANPVLLDQHSVGLNPFYRKLDVQGKRAYVANYAASTYSGLVIYDVSDPSNLDFLDYGSLSYATDVHVEGEVAFIADGTFGVYIINVSDPFSMSVISSFTHTGNVTSLWVQGYHLYVTANGINDDLSIYDITDLSSPTAVNLASSSSVDHYDVFVDGDACYVAAVNPAVTVYFNVSDPFNPSWTGGVVTGTIGEPRGVWGFGPYMIAANYSAGVALIEAYLNNMAIVTSYTGPSNALQVMVHGDYAYVANRTSLMILQLFQSAGATYTVGTSTAQSVVVDTTNYVIENATLTPTAYVPTGTTIDWFLSADGGTHWESVTPGVKHTFTYPGSDLRWRADLDTSRDDASVHLNSLSITYEYNDPPSPPTLTDPGTTDTDGDFTVSWTVSTDPSGYVVNYELEMSDSNAFTTILDTWTPTSTSQAVSGLSNGTYYFRVHAIDDDSAISDWSNIEDIEVAIPPTTTTPTTTSPPPIPGFPWAALLLGLVAALGTLVVTRRRKR
jgi:hypothetical protein